MGNGKNNAALKAEQDQAAKMALPNPQASQLASFDVSQPYKLLKFDKGTGAKDSGFTFEQNGVKFGAGTFDTQYDAVSKFDPSQPFKIGNGTGKVPVLSQGSLSFTIPNPVALTSPLDAATVSPNAATADTSSGASNTNALTRVPKNLKPGVLAGTAAARAISGADISKSKPTALKKPLISGY